MMSLMVCDLLACTIDVVPSSLFTSVCVTRPLALSRENLVLVIYLLGVVSALVGRDLGTTLKNGMIEALGVLMTMVGICSFVSL